MNIAIVGSGLYGATIAYLMRMVGHEVTIYESDHHLGGNVRTEYDEHVKLHVPEFGAHIFHTNSERVWEFVNQFSSFNSYKHFVKGDIAWSSHIDLPFGMSMFSKILQMHTPERARRYFDAVRKSAVAGEGNTVESWCLANIGHELYAKVVKHYTERQWGRPCNELPKSIIQRLPMRFTYDTTYFHNAKYQGMPVDGYTKIIERMIGYDSDNDELQPNVHLETGVEVTINKLERIAAGSDHVFFSGPIDRLFHYDHGELEYRSLKFQNKYLPVEYEMGIPVLNNLTDIGDHSRVIEHKLFYPEVKSEGTILTVEYPDAWDPSKRAYYPVRTDVCHARHQVYLKLVEDHFKNVTVGGRLGSFMYLDMDQVIGMAMMHAKRGLGVNE